ncbi:ATP-binding protein [Streptomyces sp. NPDC000349]|uniref:ATP-binding protein n=1 Tax=Streptomyces sp. NPDC000349 TaxID=3154249 RepID=UPI0027879682|nr:ATP-binding protein [Streptomyces sp. DSM 40167]MDQ0408762.1 hypothetical protein [Streptomyces sp. DSM 40167]
MSELTGTRIRTTAVKLGLPHLADALNQYVQRADEAKMGYLDFLDLVLSEELATNWKRSPARLPGEILRRLAQDLALFLQLVDLLPQSDVLRFQRRRRLGLAPPPGAPGAGSLRPPGPSSAGFRG